MDATCFCSGDVGVETDQCGEKCAYEEWQAWGPCLVDDDQTACVPRGSKKMGQQKRTRGISCGNPERCCGREDTRACFIPECREYKNN